MLYPTCADVALNAPPFIMPCIWGPPQLKFSYEIKLSDGSGPNDKG